jgi:hypothetical protein
MMPWRLSSIAWCLRTSVVPSVRPAESIAPQESWATARFLVIADMAMDQCLEMAARDASIRDYRGAQYKDAGVA